MRFFRGLLPNLTICLNVTLLVVLYLDRRNPMMGFFMDWPFAVLLVASALCSILMAVFVYSGWRNRRERKNKSHLHTKNQE